MSRGAFRLHLRMYTKFPRPRNRFRSSICKLTTPAQYATVWCPRSAHKASLPLLWFVEARLRPPLQVHTLQSLCEGTSPFRF